MLFGEELHLAGGQRDGIYRDLSKVCWRECVCSPTAGLVRHNKSVDKSVTTQIFSIFTPIPGGDDPMWRIFYQMGWFNHQVGLFIVQRFQGSTGKLVGFWWFWTNKTPVFELEKYRGTTSMNTIGIYEMICIYYIILYSYIIDLTHKYHIYCIYT